MPPLTFALWLATGLQVAFAAPAPQSSSTPGTTVTEQQTWSVDCGCWNMCTLEQQVNPDLECPQTCDPKFLCENILVAAGIAPAAEPADPADSVVAKRAAVATALPPSGETPPINPFGSGGEFEDANSFRNKRDAKLPNVWPPPFLPEDDLLPVKRSTLEKRLTSIKIKCGGPPPQCFGEIEIKF